MKYHNIPTLFDNQASLINGKNIGTDSVRYIQDAGQKTAGTTYIDKNTNELYVCVTTTDSVNNDGNFSKFNLKEAFNKLDIQNKVYEFIDLTQIGDNIGILSETIKRLLYNVRESILVLAGFKTNTEINFREILGTDYMPYETYGNSLLIYIWNNEQTVTFNNIECKFNNGVVHSITLKDNGSYIEVMNTKNHLISHGISVIRIN